MATRIDLEQLTVDYGSGPVVDGLDLVVEPGTLVALLGPSGCGKSTTLRAVAGLLQPRSGDVRFDGASVLHLAPERRPVAMVFQAPLLFPHMSIGDNVAFGLRMRGVGRAERRRLAEQALERVRLPGVAGRRPGELSGGQEQRVSLARALVLQPSVLLLDEPLSALDAKVRTQLREEIRRVQIEVGTTTLFVTHDQEEALAIADRVGVMNAGRLEQIASPEELYARPASGFVAGFVGLTNRVPATVVDGEAMVLGAAVPTLAGSASGGGHALIRPEALSLTEAASGNATVSLVSFLGPISRVTCQADGTTLVAQTSSALASRLSVGDRVHLQVEPVPVLVVAD